MKKLTLILTLVILSFSSQAQNIIQVSNDGNSNSNNNNQKKECEYRINGICSTEDIGGVDVEFNAERQMVLTNYNNCTVTVLWEVEYKTSNYNCWLYERVDTGQTIVKANETKIVSRPACSGGNWSLKGMIVRKIQQ